MAFTLGTDTLLTFPQAAEYLPGRPNIGSLHRWRLKGVRGVRLETCLIGGSRYTSVEALQHFLDRTTAARDASPSRIGSANSTRQLSDAVAAEKDSVALDLLLGTNLDQRPVRKNLPIKSVRGIDRQ